MPVRFVYFDAAFTLLQPWPSVGYHYARLAASHGVEADGAALEAAFRPAWKAAVAASAAAGDLPYGRTMDEARRFWAEVIRQCFLKSAATPPHDPTYYHNVFDTFSTRECWQVYPDVLAALAMLDEAGIPAGVFSNWDPRLHLVLDAVGLRSRFRVVAISSELGFEKPRNEAFTAAAALSGRPPAELAMIGDELQTDVAAALAAGWSACHLDRPASPGVASPADPSAPDLCAAVERLLGFNP